MSCVNLVELFGGKYRTGFDPAYDPRHVPRKALDPWMMTIPCSRGVICPYGGDDLIAEVEDRPRIANGLRQLSCVEVFQDGDRFVAVKFHVRDFEEVSKVLRPRRKPRLTAERRAALAKHMLAVRSKAQAKRAPEEPLAEEHPLADEEPLTEEEPLAEEGQLQEKMTVVDSEIRCQPELETGSHARAKSRSESQQRRLFLDD